MRVSALTIALFSMALSASADEDQFEFRREVTPVDAGGIGSVVIDAAMYESLDAGFRDLRVIRKREGEAIEWPYLIARTSEGAVRSPAKRLGGETISFREKGNGSIEAVVRLDEGLKGAGTLRIETPLRDFEKSVDVDGSDGETWEPLLEGALVFDRERFIDFRRTELVLPANEFGQYRVTISDATDEQRSSVRKVTEAFSESSDSRIEQTMEVRTRVFRIDSLSFYSLPVDRSAGQGEMAYPIELVSVEENEEDQETEILLRAGGVPLRSLVLETDATNFQRAVRLEVPAGEDQWRTIKRGVIQRFRIGEVDEETLSLRFDEQRSHQYRLIIENGDSPPLEIAGVSGMGECYEVRFLIEPGESFALLYGAESPEVKSPKYDVAALQRGLKAKAEVVPLSLGAMASNPAFSEEPKSIGSLLEQPWILWVLIGVVVAVLIWVLVGAAKRVEGMSE